MKKVLYISNIEVPYRTKFYNELACKCELTVLYERLKSSSRDSTWVNSEKRKYNVAYLNGININSESSFSFKIFKYLNNKYDYIIIGCYNSPIQILAILYLKFLRIPFYINLDGEQFLDNTIKGKGKQFVLKCTKNFFVAGEKSAENLRYFLPNSNIVPYYFGTMYKDELLINGLKRNNSIKSDEVLVVGQYLFVKGLDFIVELAKKYPKNKYKIVGTGVNTDRFISDYNVSKIENIEIIPFLQKTDLEKEYCKCKYLIFPSRKECWGLVINEAASYGTPIVSTLGSGAAMEFLKDDYIELLADCDNFDSLVEAIECLDKIDVDKYSIFLRNKSQKYSIEHSVDVFVNELKLLK